MSSTNSCKTVLAFFSDISRVHKRFFIPNYYFFQTNHNPVRKGRSDVAVRKGIPDNLV
jgi:hypothetical protein